MKKAWIVQGGWDGHEPKLTSARFGRLLEKNGYEVKIWDTLDCLGDLDALMEQDLGPNPTTEETEALLLTEREIPEEEEECAEETSSEQEPNGENDEADSESEEPAAEETEEAAEKSDSDEAPDSQQL